jgi:hypothetical protein
MVRLLALLSALLLGACALSAGPDLPSITGGNDSESGDGDYANASGGATSGVDGGTGGWESTEPVGGQGGLGGAEPE